MGSHDTAPVFYLYEEESRAFNASAFASKQVKSLNLLNGAMPCP